jgi:DNA-binding transcriptional MocR family regulator
MRYSKNVMKSLKEIIMVQKKSTFKDKWGDKIAAAGHTQLPNLLIKHMGELEVKPSEFTIIAGILVHKRSKADPFPSIRTLSMYSGLTEKSVSRLVSSLRRKRLIRTNEPNGKVNRYDFSPLVMRLESYAQSPQNQQLPPAKMRVPPPTNLRDEEEAVKKKRERRHFGSGKTELLADIMARTRGPY